jgi:hypothetical protein
MSLTGVSNKSSYMSVESSARCIACSPSLTYVEFIAVLMLKGHNQQPAAFDAVPGIDHQTKNTATAFNTVAGTFSGRWTIETSTIFLT